MKIDHQDVKVFYLSDIEIPLPSNDGASICLLAADHWECFASLERIVDTLVPRGCRFFMSWGGMADRLHEELDEVLENRGQEYLDVVTTSHYGESLSEVLWFFFNAAMPGESHINYFVGIERNARSASLLLQHLIVSE